MSRSAEVSGARRWHAELAWVQGKVREQVLLEVDGDRLAAVRPDTPAPAGATRLSGLTIPGLANGHSHAFHRALRGRTHAASGTFWTWRDAMYRVAARLDPDRYHALARATFAEMALAGVTAVGEFHYVHHTPDGTTYDDPNAMGAALVVAAGEAGIRITLLDTCYLSGGFGRPPDGPQRRFSDGDADAWAQRADALAGAVAGRPTVRVGAAIHSVRAVEAGQMGVVRDWALGRDAPLHLHLSEQRAENQACLAATGRTPTELVESVGVLGRNTTAVHATHLTATDATTLGASATTVCVCPTTERDLADGIGPARALRDAGSPLCVGSDSNAVIDLFEEARAVELDERLATQRRGCHRGDDLLAAATTAGARALGWDVALAPGSLADFVSVDLRSVRTAGATGDTAVDTVVFAAAAGDVRSVVVGGRTVVADGAHGAIPDVAGALDAALRDVHAGPA